MSVSLEEPQFLVVPEPSRLNQFFLIECLVSSSHCP